MPRPFKAILSRTIYRPSTEERLISKTNAACNHCSTLELNEFQRFIRSHPRTSEIAFLILMIDFMGFCDKF